MSPDKPGASVSGQDDAMDKKSAVHVDIIGSSFPLHAL
jgi:hypothetical protein